MTENIQSTIKARARRRRRRPFRVMLVDNDPRTRDAFTSAITEHHTHQIELIPVASVPEARRVLEKSHIDLVVIEPTISSGAGLGLAQVVVKEHSPTQAIVMAELATFESALAAIRAGATDLITKPIVLGELNERVQQAIVRSESEMRKEARVRRLRRVCKKLNAAREEVSQQVDILCNDLVTAYQELADQMHNVVETSEFAALVRNELDLERLLHQSLEFILEKVGPTNAAIFLPVTADEFTLGGYVNYDCADGSPELLLNHLADVVAPRAGESETAIHITDNDTLAEWIGDDSAYLTDCHMLAVPCWTENEVLAVMVLFRDGAQPFNEEITKTCAAIAPLLAQYLGKIVRVHHRHMQD
ncbi:MAG: response regulator [Phycisphaeraceae bacterium]